MRVAGIDKCELCNGNDIGASFYVQGCNSHCKNCFNPETWDFNGGEPFSDDIKSNFFSIISKPYIKRVSFLGGEPLHPENIKTVLSIIKEIKSQYPQKIIWVYTGFDFKSLFVSENTVIGELLNIVDYIVDGRYVDELRDVSLPFRGSSNQRIWRRSKNVWIDTDNSKKERFTR